MELFEVIPVLLFIVFGLIFFLWVSFKDQLYGGYRLFTFSKKRLGALKERSAQSQSETEQQAIKEIFLSIDGLNVARLTEWEFKVQTLYLIEKIASIYHPNVLRPMEQARLAEIFEALKEASQKVLSLVHLPGVEFLTRFRVSQFFENSKGSSGKSPGVFSFMILKIEERVLKSILAQWQLLVGESAIRVYSETSLDEEVEAEEILSEWDRLQEEPDPPLSENVQQIAESSKKEILFSVTSISWKRAGRIYFNLADQIARHYHPDSEFPIYEMRVCDLLKSVSGFLEGLGQRGQNPVLNKILKIRISQLTQAKEIALPLGENKLLEWTNRYQVGRIAKWSHTLFKTLQKKQPGILLRDVVFSMIKEGGKRSLVLYLHGKIAAEANKLYGR